MLKHCSFHFRGIDQTPLTLPTLLSRSAQGIGSNHFVVVVFQADQFQQIIKQLADMEGVNEDNILLSLRDENIVPFDTPLAVRLTVADIIGTVQANLKLL